MAVRLAGRAEVPLKLSVFDDHDGVPERRYVSGDAFDGRLEIQVSA
jgi:hypothetical protein